MALTVTVLSCMHSAYKQAINVGQPTCEISFSRQLLVVSMHKYRALPYIQLFVIALSRCYCCAGADAGNGSGDSARLDISEEVVKGSTTA